MIFHIEDSEIVYQDSGVTGKKIVNLKGVEYVELTLSENSSIAPHTLPFNVDFFIISGEGKLLIGDKTYPVKKGDLIRVNRDIERSVITESNQNIKILVIKHMA